MANFINTNNTEEKSKTNLGEQRRLKSIAEMKKTYQKQKNIIKTALMRVDLKSGNKLIFDNIKCNDDPLIQNNISTNENNSNKKALFECDEDDDIVYDFEVKKQFQGAKGKKLMELQSKFKNDKRFAMDERFLEDGNSNDETFQDEEVSEIVEKKLMPIKKYTTEEMEITQEEKEKELTILEDILGKKIIKKDYKETNNKKSTKTIRMTRYDPSNPEHCKYILKEDIKDEKQKQKNIKSEVNTEVQGIEKPIVSKETFYEISDNLKETLEENKPFSLLNILGSHKTLEGIGLINQNIENEHVETTSIIRSNDNPFHYDSSEESNNEDVDNSIEDEKNEYKNKSEHDKQNILLGPTKLWTESFFFKDDDYRFQEGIDFVRKFELDDKTEFKQIRRNIKEIVRAKVKNNQRKHKPFRKKLGGRKMIKMKKAIKKR